MLLCRSLNKMEMREGDIVSASLTITVEGLLITPSPIYFVQVQKISCAARVSDSSPNQNTRAQWYVRNINRILLGRWHVGENTIEREEFRVARQKSILKSGVNISQQADANRRKRRPEDNSFSRYKLVYALERIRTMI